MISLAQKGKAYYIGNRWKLNDAKRLKKQKAREGEKMKFPAEIDDFLFDDLNALMSVKSTNYIVRKTYLFNDVRAKLYLGKYYPRTFCELYEIFKLILKQDEIANSLRSKEIIKILDLGCGPGCATHGLLWLFKETFGCEKKYEVYCIDGNENMTADLHAITERFFPNTSLRLEKLEFDPTKENIDNFKAKLEKILTEVDEKFDIIIVSKFINEVYTEDWHERLYSKTKYNSEKSIADNNRNFGIPTTFIKDKDDDFYKIVVPSYQYNKGAYKLMLELSNKYLDKCGILYISDPNICVNWVNNDNDIYINELMKEEIQEYLNHVDTILQLLIEPTNRCFDIAYENSRERFTKHEAFISAFSTSDSERRKGE